MGTKKRRVARAIHEGAGRYRVLAPEPVGDLDTFLDRLSQGAPDRGVVLLGVDFPLGLPHAYAARAGVRSFRALLPELGRGPWRDFFRVAETAEEIGLRRPFYPLRAGRRGRVARAHLVERLGLDAWPDLWRACDRGHAQRAPACALFWTLGPQQVGKAAIVGWRDVLIPALRNGRDVRLWPFEGNLQSLLRSPGVVVAETYPAEIYAHLGLRTSAAALGKRRRQTRADLGPPLLDRLHDLGARPEPALLDAMAAGFGDGPDGEDSFDAVVGMTGMLNVVRGHRPAGAPPDAAARAVEGWILGQTAE